MLQHEARATRQQSQGPNAVTRSPSSAPVAAWKAAARVESRAYSGGNSYKSRRETTHGTRLYQNLWEVNPKTDNEKMNSNSELSELFCSLFCSREFEPFSGTPRSHFDNAAFYFFASPVVSCRLRNAVVTLRLARQSRSGRVRRSVRRKNRYPPLALGPAHQPRLRSGRGPPSSIGFFFGHVS